MNYWWGGSELFNGRQNLALRFDDAGSVEFQGLTNATTSLGPSIPALCVRTRASCGAFCLNVCMVF